MASQTWDWLPEILRPGVAEPAPSFWDLIESPSFAGGFERRVTQPGSGNELMPPPDLRRIMEQLMARRDREVQPVLGTGEGGGLEPILQMLEGRGNRYTVALSPEQLAVLKALSASPAWQGAWRR